MKPSEMTEWYRKDLQTRTDRARAAREAEAERARAFGEAAPEGLEEDGFTKLWTSGGYYAFIFCLWFAFTAPIILILLYWD
jgi:hypothetical protein